MCELLTHVQEFLLHSAELRTLGHRGHMGQKCVNILLRLLSDVNCYRGQRLREVQSRGFGIQSLIEQQMWCGVLTQGRCCEIELFAVDLHP